MAEPAEGKRLYKIGEVCRLADVQPYVLRYWETEFAPLAPNKSGGGQRLYTQREIDLILRIKQLLYAEGFTIAGAKKRLDGELASPEVPPTPPPDPTPASEKRNRPRTGTASKRVLLDVRRQLTEILALLDD